MLQRWSILVVGVVATCGGKAVIDTEPEDAASSAASTGSSGSPSSSGAGASDPGARRCAEICAHAAENGCLMSDCERTCVESSANDRCRAERDALMSCWADNLQSGVCSPPAECATLHNDYLRCSGDTFDYNGCPDVSAESKLPTGSCSSVACDFEGSTFFETCWCPRGDDFERCTCECFANGVLVGTCDDYASEGCYALAACCEFVF